MLVNRHEYTGSALQKLLRHPLRDPDMLPVPDIALQGLPCQRNVRILRRTLPRQCLLLLFEVLRKEMTILLLYAADAICRR